FILHALEAGGAIVLGPDFFENNLTFYLTGFAFLIISLTGGFLLSARLRKANRIQKKVFDLVKQSPSPTFAINSEYKIIYWNSAMRGLCGFGEQDMAGMKNYWKLFYTKKKPLPVDLLMQEKNKKEAENLFATVKSSGCQGECLVVEDFCPVLGDNGRWLLMGAVVLKDKRGKPESAVQILQDINDFKEKESDLLTEIRRDTDYLKGVKDVFFAVASSGKILNFNEEAVKISGYSQEELKELDFFKDLVSTGGEGYPEKLIKDFTSGSKEVFAEAEMKDKDRNNHLFSWKITFRKDRAGNFQEFVFAGTEISVLREKEIENKILLDFFDKAPHPFLRISRDGVVIYHNKASQSCLKGWGYQTSRPLDTPWRDIIEIVLDTGKIRKEEFKCGDSVLSLLFHPCSDECVNVYGIDVTGIKHARQTIEQLSRISGEDSNLVLRVSGEGEIIYDNKAGFSILRDWHYRDGPLLIDYWHQFVLKALGSGMSQQLEAKFGDSYCSFTFTPIIDSNYVNVYLFDITEARLAAEKSRSMAGEEDAGESRKKNNINEVVKEIYERRRSAAKEKDIDFDIDLDSEIPEIIFDREKINQAVDNLLTYAFNATDRGLVRISTSLEGDNIVRVSVKDSGPGIREEDLPGLFYLFEEEGVSKKDSEISAGLAMAKYIVENHNGKIWAESKIDKGTVFHFILPVKERRKLSGQGPTVKEKRT
ncbi:MAG: PAS domain S-box protein, partial [Candidatus Omnitrophica bacterium]|nr:PAS domain S-box protein [Candidatus Omnitrophota bacterium]